MQYHRQRGGQLNPANSTQLILHVPVHILDQIGPDPDPIPVRRVSLMWLDALSSCFSSWALYAFMANDIEIRLFLPPLNFSMASRLYI